MRRNRATALILGALLSAVALVSLGGCARFFPPSATPIPPEAAVQSTATPLASVEVTSYKGKQLDIVASEPENSIKGPQQIDIANYRLAVNGLVSTPTTLAYSDVLAMPAFKKVTTLNCVEGWSRTYLWTGVRLTDVLERAGGPLPTANTVIFWCEDGYSTSLPLDYIKKRQILLAYGMNGATMPAERGFPFQVVAEDRLGYKWAKWVTRIELGADPNFRGYWEQRGYDNDAAVPGN